MVPERAKPLRQARRPPPADTRVCYTRSPTTIVRFATSTRTCRVVQAQFTISRTLMSLNRITFTFISECNPEEYEWSFVVGVYQVGSTGRLD